MIKQKHYIYEIANVYSGYTFRQKIEHQEDGDINVIQAKDVRANFINESEIIKVQGEGIKRRFWLEKGDVLFLAKGSNNFASLFNSSRRSIAVAAFFVLKVKELQKILPEFLMYYINSPLGQKQLEMGKEGTYVTNISKKSLEEMTITLPSVEEQKRLCKLFELAELEIQLTKQLVEKKIELSKSIYNKTLQ